MIIPPTDCFWMVRVEGDAAEFVAHALSTSSMCDIHEAVLISQDYKDDISGTNSMDEFVEYLKQSLPHEELVEMTNFNPLYVPSTPAQLDEVLDGDYKSETVAFTGMDGSPFTMKTIGISFDGQNIIQGKLACRPFDLPSYSDILQGQKNVRLN